MSGMIKENAIPDVEIVFSNQRHRSAPEDSSFEQLRRPENRGTENWRITYKSDIFRHLYQSGMLSDIKLEVGTSEKKVFQAHKLILCMSSGVFKNWFQNLVLEPDATLRIKDVDANDFNNILRFMYTEEIDDDIAVCIRTYKLAKRFEVKKYIKACMKQIENNFTWQDIFAVFDFALTENDDTILQRAHGIFISKASVIFEMHEFLDCPKILLKDIIKEVAPGIDPFTLFSALFLWSENHMKKSKDDSLMQKIFVPFLPYIRFLDMTAEEFADVSQIGVLAEEDIATISSHFSRKYEVPLPEWCHPRTLKEIDDCYSLLLPIGFKKPAESYRTVVLSCRFKVVKEDIVIRGVGVKLQKQKDRRDSNICKAKVVVYTVVGGERRCEALAARKDDYCHLMFSSFYILHKNEECTINVCLPQEVLCKYLYDEGNYLEKSVVVAKAQPFIIVRCLAPKMDSFGLISKIFLSEA